MCDLPEKYEQLKVDYEGSFDFLLSARWNFYTADILASPSIKVLRDGHQVSRTSDFIIYSVEAEFIGRVVAQFGPCM